MPDDRPESPHPRGKTVSEVLADAAALEQHFAESRASDRPVDRPESPARCPSGFKPTACPRPDCPCEPIAALSTPAGPCRTCNGTRTIHELHYPEPDRDVPCPDCSTPAARPPSA